MVYYGELADASTTVSLWADEVELIVDDQPQRLPCAIVLETDPRPMLLFRISGLDPWMVLRPQRQFSLHFVRADITCAAFIASSDDGVIAFTPNTEPIAVGTSQSLAHVEFDLINFPHFFGMATPTTRLPDDHLDITGAGWELQVRPRRQSPETAAFRSTLYAVTHSCTLSKHTRADFSSKDAQAFLVVLHDALSFAAGQWVGQVFVGGFDSREQMVWQQWGTGRLHPHLGHVDTWFDRHHGNTLGEILPGLLVVQHDPVRAKNIHSAIYWYIRASGIAPGVDGGIILLQAALELLSWQHFIIDGNAGPPKQTAKAPASDRIRLLLQSCGIPTAIPPGLTDLAAIATKSNWQDGPKTLAAVRNLLVHPNKQHPVPFYDAWRLAEWYVELVLLHMMSFNGEYSNRTKAQRWVGAVEPVPWATA